MKVALVNQPLDGSLPPTQTSLSIWSYQVARRLASDHDVTVYGKKNGPGEKVELRDGVRYFHASPNVDRRLMPLLDRFASPSPTLPVATARTYGLGYAMQVALDLRAQKCDRALVFNYSQFAPVIKRISPRTGVILNMQCEWLSQFDPTVIRRRLRNVDAIVGCSDYIARKIRERFPDFQGPCRALFNGVDIQHFSGDGHRPAPDGRKRLLFVGRISPEKGVHVLIDAFVRLLDRHPDAQLDIVGAHAVCPRDILVDLSDEPTVRELARFYDERGYFGHLQDRIEAAGIGDHVIFSGFVPHAESAEHYHAAHVLINPSLSEAFGMSLAEAMAAGVPVVATRVGGMPEIVDDGQTGRLVEPDDAEALAKAILDVLADEGRRRAMGLAGRNRAKHLFSWDRIADELRSICASV